jgi:hypothetical protein
MMYVILQSLIQDRDSRISELEDALRESIRITAQREVVMAEQQMKLEHTERMVNQFCKRHWSLNTQLCSAMFIPCSEMTELHQAITCCSVVLAQLFGRIGKPMAVCQH